MEDPIIIDMSESFINPYYLHHGDSPGSVLVSLPLDGDNYHTWSRSMIMALTAKNKLGFMDGSIIKPVATASTYLPWIRCNTMMLSWILNSVSKDIAASVIYLNTAEEIWLDLKERFSQKNGPRIYQIQKSISSLSQENLTISTYYTKLKALWEELNNYRPISACSCGAQKSALEYFQQESVFQFLMGLNDSFSHIRGRILLIDPLPPMNKVFSLLLQEERQREISSSVGYFNHNTAALASKAISNTPSRFSKPAMRKDRPICTHCGIPGHIVEKCYKLHGYPPGFKFTRTRTPQQAVHSANQVQELEHPSSFTPPFSITQEQCQKLLALINPSASASDTASAHQVCVSPANQDHLFSKMTGNHFVNSVEFLNIKHSVFYSSHALKAASENFQHSSWIIDTGATDHMVNSISYFTTISVVESRYVKLPNGQLALITHIGTVRISQELTLHDVLCVPSFSFNLISVSKLIQTLHCCLIFLGSYCFMQNLSPWTSLFPSQASS
jgi:hypothetical protein